VTQVARRAATHCVAVVSVTTMYDMWWLVISLAIAGCASAGKGNSITSGVSDAGAEPADGAAPSDASGGTASDAPASRITLAQTDSATITTGNSIACENKLTNVTVLNSYLRVFALADFGVTDVLHVTEVAFGVDTAVAGPRATAQPAQVKLGLYEATPGTTTLDPSAIVALGDAVAIQIPDGKATTITVPVTADVQAGQNLIVELALPDGTAAGSTFLIGSNALGERAPGYLSARDCGLKNPTTIQSIASDLAHGPVDLLISVTGER